MGAFGRILFTSRPPPTPRSHTLSEQGGLIGKRPPRSAARPFLRPLPEGAVEFAERDVVQLCQFATPAQVR
jgi:hypothetical protein